MKKILCLIDTMGIGGGAERQMAGLTIMLLQRGYNVDLVTYHNHETYPELAQQPNLRIIPLQTKNSKWAKLMAVRRHMKAVGGYDWIIAYKDGPTIIGCILKLLGGGFSLIVSERNTNQCINMTDRIKFFLYRFADYIVPNSHAQKDFIKLHFPVLANKVRTITNFTDTTNFNPTETHANAKLNILTVGRITPQKNIITYLEAIKLLKLDGYADKVHFNWIGDAQSGDNEYKRSCLKKVKDLMIGDIIDFYPATKDIVKQYQSCDIFCLPSIYEGFPNVVCEAMSCGKPIVCSRVCDNPYIVEENRNGLLFDPQNVTSIYTTLKEVIEMDQSTRDEWGIASRSIAESRFSKETFVNKYIELIE